MYNYNRQYRSRYGCFQSRYVCMYVLEDIDRQICLYDSDMNDVLRTGLFMALQPKMITCGKWVAAISMGMKFVVGPAVMAVASLAIGIRGKLLHVAIIQVFIHSNTHHIYIYSLPSTTRLIYIYWTWIKQAALPVGIVPFVFAKEYDVHADLLSTS